VTIDAGARVAVIPARGGSKRVPRKNIRIIDGRPLVAWSVDTCLAAGLFDQVVVTTDDEEIAEAARAAGAEVPFVREPGLSDDHAPLVPVVADALERLGLGPDAAGTACCVYPTAIGLLPDDLVDAWALLAGQDARPYVVGVVRYGHPVQRALTRDDTGALAMVDPATAQTRTQDLEARWHDAGQFVWGTLGAWLHRTPVLTHALGHELPAWRAIDLDTEDDWARAEALHPLIRQARLG
jgi:pseudaminic acid cytidylyltransferase